MKRAKRLVLGLSTLGLAFVVLVATTGEGGTSQFNPATLECRGVSQYYVPYVGWEVWSRARPYRPRIVQFWLDEGYAQAGGTGGRWDTITSWVSWRRLSSSGPAKAFWHNCGCAHDEGAEEWVAWSRRHPALAADLWPRVIGLLRQEADSPDRGGCYGAAALLMVHVEGAEDERTYDERVARWERESNLNAR